MRVMETVNRTPGDLRHLHVLQSLNYSESTISMNSPGGHLLGP